jgi:hypothetical protein
MDDQPQTEVDHGLTGEHAQALERDLRQREESAVAEHRFRAEMRAWAGRGGPTWRQAFHAAGPERSRRDALRARW